MLFRQPAPGDIGEKQLHRLPNILCLSETFHLPKKPTRETLGGTYLWSASRTHIETGTILLGVKQYVCRCISKQGMNAKKQASEPAADDKEYVTMGPVGRGTAGRADTEEWG